ncbi:TnsD family Tn7-like transposition protein [Paenibacillus anseongense]|uniref:TnsD family Tn7-like transposition protein n=1 Tax=Paenibacillus anseongense TaxID=2682845 RepID=UPI002DBBDD39|nr:TnsD family Tn7-like transposition protein [Paenibacillus anseongense]MEC0270479.1 TnsD family Tn7-like transposition protein [Paenibacillus anseongense]
MSINNFFPSPYDEEDYRSIILRYHYMTGNDRIYKTINNLFGFSVHSYNNSLGVIPHSLNKLASNKGLSLNQTIPEKNTVIPIIKPFLNEKNRTLLNEYIYNYGTHGNPLIKFIYKLISTKIRYCRICLDEDYENVGECYIHRLHQLIFIKFCYKHHVPLIIDKDDNLLINRHKINSGNFIYLECGEEEINIKRNLLTDISTLLSFVESIDCNFIYEKFIQVLGYKGYITHLGKIKKRVLFSNFLNEMPKSLCEEYNLYTYLKAYKLSKLFNKEKMNADFMVYLFLMRFLCGSVLDFLKSNYEYASIIPFGNGPWSCRNPVCDSRDKNVIYRVSRHIPCSFYTEKCNISVDFKCPICDFSYRRKSESDYITVIYTGEKWDKHLLDLHLKGKSTYSISLILGMNMDFINQHLKRICEAKMNDQSNADSKKDVKRKDFIDLINKIPENERNRIRIINANEPLYNWLSKYDSEWFLKVIPESQRGMKKLDYSEIDKQISQQVLKIVKKLKEENKFYKKVTVSAIIEALSSIDRNRFLGNKELLPQTKKLLEHLAETTDEYALRRLEDAIQCLKNSNKSISMNTLKSNFSVYRIISSEIESYICKQLEFYVEHTFQKLINVIP